MMKIKPPRNVVMRKLQHGKVSLEFIKANGELREMTGTLQARFMPDNQIPESAVNDPAPKDPDLVRCFDLELNQWRSFKISTLTKFDPV